MAEYRMAEEREDAAVLDFINMVFSVDHEPHDFKRLIPKVYGDDACLRAAHAVAVANGRVEGVAGLLEERLHVLDEALPVGLIGSVSTHPYARGAGHMKACMSLLLREAEDRGLALLYLGGRRQRYEYFGFSQGGTAVTCSFHSGNVRHGWGGVDAGGIRFAPLNGYEDAAARLHSGQPVYAERGSERFLRIASTWGCRPFAVLTEEGFLGYCVASENGEELSELCLTAESHCAPVLKAWFEWRGLSRLRVSVPVWNRERLRLLSRVAQHVDQGNSEMFRIQDLAPVARAFLRLKAQYCRLEDGRFILQMEGGVPVAMEVRAGGVTVEETDEAPHARLTRQEAQDLLLSNCRWVDTSALPRCVESWFPLPVAVSEADGF